MKFKIPLLLMSTLFITNCSSVKNQTRKVSSSDLDMEYVDVCNRQGDCKKFSRLIMGTDHLLQSDWTKNGQPAMPEEEFAKVLDEAVKLGINLFDTSPIYVGSVENRLGKWLDTRKQEIQKDEFYYAKDLNPDRKLYTISKGGFPFDLYYSKKLPAGSHSRELKVKLHELGILNTNASPSLAEGEIELHNIPPGTYASRLFGTVDQIKGRVAEEINHSSNQLNQDITIYLMHRDDGDYLKFEKVERDQTPVQDIMEALSAPEISSKYWMVGWSNWKTERINESLKLSKMHSDLTLPALNSSYFSLFEMSERTIHAGGVQVTHEEMNTPDFQKGIKQMSYSPLGGFSFFDKPEPRWENAKKDAKEKFDRGDAYWQNVYNAIFTETNKTRYDRVVEFTEKFNKEHNSNYSIDQMVNAYALAHKRTDFLTVGPITVEQLRRTVGALKLSSMLSDDNLDYLYSGK
ncbi:MAG: aldo/keto reductase [Bacteriovorax sp.]|nr:aldo/keto reductase [Bacteriovorax sp.]